jgi:hypothetical protein
VANQQVKKIKFKMKEHTPKYITTVKGSSNKVFGLVFSAIFILISLYPIFDRGSIRIWAPIIASVFLILSLVAPTTLNFANKL